MLYMREISHLRANDKLSLISLLCTRMLMQTHAKHFSPTAKLAISYLHRDKISRDASSCSSPNRKCNSTAFNSQLLILAAYCAPHVKTYNTTCNNFSTRGINHFSFRSEHNGAPFSAPLLFLIC